MSGIATIWARRHSFKSLGKRPSFGWFTEFQNPELMTIGDDFSCGRYCVLSGELSIGNHCHINNNVQINAACGGSITIGDECMIGPNVVIRSANHRHDRIDIPMRVQGHTSKPIIIGRNVWICANVVVAAGARIWDNAIVPPNTVVRE